MKELLRGLVGYRQGFHQEHQALFDKLKSGQQPRVLFITCSDSRVSPAHITQCDPGELFVIRNAGNLVPPPNGGGESGTLEYAMTQLPIEHVVVCGHSDCGAMKGLFNTELPQVLPQVGAWLRNAEPTRAALQNAPALERLPLAIEHNVRQQLANLEGHPSVAAKLKQNAVTVHGWVYDIGSGVVRAYDRQKEAFLPLNE